MNELVSRYGVHPTQITKWKKQLQSELPQIFSQRREKHAQDQEALQAQLYQQIGQLKVELDWLKKNYRCNTHSAHGVTREDRPKETGRVRVVS